MTQYSEARRIEADIEQDRAKLASTLDALQDRISVDTLAQDALGMLRANTESYTRSIDHAVRANPMALTLVGVGLAWLVFGSRKAALPDKTKLEAISAWEDDGGPARPSDEQHDDWLLESDGLRKRASETLKRLEVEARDITQGVRDFAAERAAVVAEFGAGLHRSLRSGLDDLNSAAQGRIVIAREAAYAARIRVERLGKITPREAGRMIEDHPMVTGAVLLALGAALGAALPRTEVEDRAFGAERDRLMDQASRLLAEERVALGRVAQGIGADLAGSAKAALDMVAESVAEAGDKVSARVERAAETV